MYHFSRLNITLESGLGADRKSRALEDYFLDAPQEDHLWAIALLTGRRPKKICTKEQIIKLALEESKTPLWLFTESAEIVGDEFETASMIIHNQTNNKTLSLRTTLNLLLSSNSITESITLLWSQLDKESRYYLNKIATGSFRNTVRIGLITKVLSAITNLSSDHIASQLARDWDPDKDQLEDVLAQKQEAQLKPTAFNQFDSIDHDNLSLGDINNWYAQFAFEGISSQILLDKNEGRIWASNSEYLQAYFPEFLSFMSQIPSGTRIHGQIIALGNDGVLPRELLFKRIGKKRVTDSLMKQSPAIFLIEDISCYENCHLHNQTYQDRIALTKTLVSSIGSDYLLFPEFIHAKSWNELNLHRMQSRKEKAIGIKLSQKKQLIHDTKNARSILWKPDPIEITAVLLYAGRAGRSWSGPYCDLTFGLKKGSQLISIGKIKSTLLKEEQDLLDEWIKSNTLERFGPVRVVKPEMVFSLLIEDVKSSSRHKSGLLLKNPVIANWIRGGDPAQINSIKTLHEWIPSH